MLTTMRPKTCMRQRPRKIISQAGYPKISMEPLVIGGGPGATLGLSHGHMLRMARRLGCLPGRASGSPSDPLRGLAMTAQDFRGASGYNCRNPSRWNYISYKCHVYIYRRALELYRTVPYRWTRSCIFSFTSLVSRALYIPYYMHSESWCVVPGMYTATVALPWPPRQCYAWQRGG